MLATQSQTPRQGLAQRNRAQMEKKANLAPSLMLLLLISNQQLSHQTAIVIYQCQDLLALKMER
jgi:hypothetical protein